jgi:hypothetical protein
MQLEGLIYFNIYENENFRRSIKFLIITTMLIMTRIMMMMMIFKREEEN